MSKRPWMPLYVGDYLAKTSHLTAEQHGVYQLLLMHYWIHGELPEDQQQLMAIARQSTEQWASNCHIVAKFFDNRWKNKRMEKELAKVKKLSEKRAYAGLKGAWSKHGRLDGNVVAIANNTTHYTLKSKRKDRANFQEATEKEVEKERKQ